MSLQDFMMLASIKPSSLYCIYWPLTEKKGTYSVFLIQYSLLFKWKEKIKYIYSRVIISSCVVVDIFNFRTVEAEKHKSKNLWLIFSMEAIPRMLGIYTNTLQNSKTQTKKSYKCVFLFTKPNDLIKFSNEIILRHVINCETHMNYTS